MPAAGKIVMATVKGDVHDIGKNIVGVVLQCNNYEVIDLGVMVPAAKILETAKREKADIIGLSGLITPSLDEMCHVAAEMERQGFNVPLLIGGATTSRVHTAVKISPHYAKARRSTSSMRAARSAWCRNCCRTPSATRYVADIRAEYVKVREAHAKQRALQAAHHARARRARQRASRSTGARTRRPRPAFLGTRAFAGYDLAELVPYIDWTPFFQTWELAGRYPMILEDAKVGEAAREAVRRRPGHAEADGGREVAHAPMPSSASGRPTRSATTSCCSTPTMAATPLATLHTLRQQIARDPGRDRAHTALADFVAPKDSGRQRLCRRLRGDGRHRRGGGARAPSQDAADDYGRIMVEGARRSPCRSLRRAHARARAP